MSVIERGQERGATTDLYKPQFADSQLSVVEFCIFLRRVDDGGS